MSGFLTAALALAAGLGLVPLVIAQADSAITGEEVKGSATIAEVEPALLEQLAERGQAKALVYLREEADLAPAFAMSWESRGHFVHQQLTESANRSQARLHSRLIARGASWQSFWVANVIVIQNADAAVVEELRHLHEVKAIRAEPEIILIEPETVEPADDWATAAPRAPEANLIHVGAPEVWAQGHTGQGITIGIIDSGVRYTHQALVGPYRGNLGGGSFDHNYHWWDPYQPAIAPHDANGHGTHVTGIVAGDDGGTNQIGMAPGARWIGCAGFDISGVATAEGLLACGQFMIAPTTLAGANAEPDRRPHAINNSWGNCQQQYNPWFEGVIDAWIAAGIVPVFSAGNAGNCGYDYPPGLNTIGNPGRGGKELGIGSTGTSDGQYATHSNWGPTDYPNPGGPFYPEHSGHPHLKPNVVAPGVLILSSYIQDDSDSTYAWATGTSMSAPHVAGLVALMWSAAPCLVGDYATTGTVIQQTARPVPYATGGTPAPSYDNHPNYATGWGEIAAVAAVAEAKIRCGPHGYLIGRVTSAATGAPIPGVAVLIDNPNGAPAQFHAWTDSEGRYRRTVAANQVPAGSYTLSYSRGGGFGSAIVSGVHVADAGNQVVDAQLDAGFLVLPDSIALEAEAGAISSFAIELANHGTLATSVTLDLQPTSLSEDFEGAFPPRGWSIVNAAGSDCGWARNDQVTPSEEPIDPEHGGRPNFAGGDGYVAVVDSDACGLGTVTDTALITPIIDLSYTGSAALTFLTSYYHLGDSRFRVLGSHDGGVTWQEHLQWASSVQPWGPGFEMTVDLDEHVGSEDVRLRFHYEGGWDWWAQIDQVRVAFEAPWADLEPLQLEIPASGSEASLLHIDASLLPGPGTYRLTLIVEHSTPEQASPVRIPVIVTVIDGADRIFANGFEGSQP
jgi:subtilisin family serine protease